MAGTSQRPRKPDFNDMEGLGASLDGVHSIAEEQGDAAKIVEHLAGQQRTLARVQVPSLLCCTVLAFPCHPLVA